MAIRTCEADAQDEPDGAICHEPDVPKLRRASRSIPGPIDFVAEALDPV
jgi:hypothetical protein